MGGSPVRKRMGADGDCEAGTLQGSHTIWPGLRCSLLRPQPPPRTLTCVVSGTGRSSLP